MRGSLARYICLSCFLFSSLQAAWSAPDTISVSGENAELPQIAIDPAGNATAVWDRSNGSNTIIQASTKPSGGSWQATPDNLSAAGQDGSVAQIAIDPAGNATAVWQETAGILNSIQASTKPFGGAWQGTPDTLSVAGQNSTEPHIAVDAAGNATAVWVNAVTRIIQASTKPFGSSWQLTPDDISLTGGNASLPQIAVDPAGNATAVWERFVGPNTIIQASTKPFGGSWQPTPDNLSAPGQNASLPEITVDAAGNATAVWQRSDGSNTIIQASTKPFGGSWQLTPDNLSAPGQDASVPEITVDAAGNATAVWVRFDGSNFIIQASTKPFGGTWQPTPDNLSAPGQDASIPEITVDAAGNATAVWERFDGSNFIIQASTKPFGGSWQASADNLSQAGQDADQPQVATDPTGDVTIAVWIRFDGTNNVIQAAEKIITPSAPSHFRGTLARRLHRTQKWLLKTHWKPSASKDISFYRIYKGSKLVDIISPNGKLHYKDHLRWRRSAKKFNITAVNSQNQESARKRLKIED